jgi:hypothetical protein
MEDVERLVLQVLATGSPLPTSAGEKVYALILPQDSGFPSVSFQRISSVPTQSLAGASGLDLVRIQIDAWARTYKEAKDLAMQIRVAMDEAARDEVLKNRPDTGFDDYEPELRVYRATSDYLCWQK